MPFLSEPITVTVVDDRMWRLDRAVTYRGRDATFVVPAGFCSDFATVPRILWWLVPRTGRHGPAAVVHDWLCVSKIISRRDADGVFRRALRELDTPILLRWLCWAGVRFGAREFDIRALAIALAALPVLGPPMLLVAVALGVYAAGEWLVGLFRGDRPDVTP